MHIINYGNILFLPPTSLRSSPPFYSPNFMLFFLSFSRKGKPKMKKKIEKSTHKNKQTKNTTIITYTMESVLCLLATPGHGACFWMWLDIPSKKISFFFFQYVCIICKQLLGWGWDFIFSVLRLYLIWTCEGFVCVVIVSVSSCVSCCGWKVLFPWSYTWPLTPRIFLPPLLLRSLNFEQGVFLKIPYLELSTLNSTPFPHCPFVGLCVNYHLLWEEISHWALEMLCSVSTAICY